MSKVLVQRILQQYGLEPLRVLDVQKGYRNESYAAELASGQMVNLIIYKREPGILDKIQNANYVSNYLAEQGMPARQSVDRRIIKLEGERIEKYAALYEYLPGATIPWEAYTMKHIKQLGKAMSDMHALLQPLSQKNLPSVLDECLALLARMEQYFADPGVRNALSHKLGLAPPDVSHLRSILEAAADLSSQPLHMDFVRGNILFNGGASITGILDFEKAAYGPTVFDIARTLAFLIIDCKYKEEAKVRKYFLHSGYNKRGAGNYTPTPLLEELVNFFLLHDLYKFLRHNPYESLPENEHFVRTRVYLLSSGSSNALNRPPSGSRMSRLTSSIKSRGKDSGASRVPIWPKPSM